MQLKAALFSQKKFRFLTLSIYFQLKDDELHFFRSGCTSCQPSSWIRIALTISRIVKLLRELCRRTTEKVLFVGTVLENRILNLLIHSAIPLWSVHLWLGASKTWTTDISFKLCSSQSKNKTTKKTLLLSMQQISKSDSITQ